MGDQIYVHVRAHEERVNAGVEVVQRQSIVRRVREREERERARDESEHDIQTETGQTDGRMGGGVSKQPPDHTTLGSIAGGYGVLSCRVRVCVRGDHMCIFSCRARHAHADASTSLDGMSALASMASSLTHGGVFYASMLTTPSGGSIALGGCELPPPLRPPEPLCGPWRVRAPVLAVRDAEVHVVSVVLHAVDPSRGICSRSTPSC